MRQWTDEIARQLRVAILTDPGGPVLPRAVSPREQVALGVAILTDPGGPVLLRKVAAAGRVLDVLRSSPTLEGRCCDRVSL